MSSYFVTGGTGFIGRRLIGRLLARPGCDTVYVLVRPGSRGRIAEIASAWPAAEKVVPVPGDLTAPGLGIAETDLPDRVDHVIHLGAVYDMRTGDELNEAVNVRGTAHVIEFAARVGAGCLHHVSSVAVAGEHEGPFRETDFDLGQRLPSPYHRTKFESEKLVREQDSVPWRVYRPAAVVGDSRTGEMDKIDGPYYFFPALTGVAKLPGFLPLVGADLGATNLVPVDYVVEALDRLLHAEHPSGSTFHLTAPRPQSLVAVYNALAKATGAPRIVASAPSRLPTAKATRRLTGSVARSARRMPGLRSVFGIPPEVLPHLTFTAEFDSTATRAALGDLEVPEFDSYAKVLLDYWSRHLDPLRARRPGPRGPLDGKRIVITGASSGIGRATAFAVAGLGAIPLLVARRTEELEQVRAEITGRGGSAFVYPCDLTDTESVRTLVKRILDEQPAVDMLVNNAGRSIRRSLSRSLDRQHDFERTMAINYFAPVRLILALLPHFKQRRFGHIVNISSMGVQTNTPRFSAYLASKAALDEFSAVAATETLGHGITFTTVHMPLVRTPMIGPTKVYDRFPAASPEQAAALVVRALVKRPKAVNKPFGVFAALGYALAPKLADRLLNVVYRVVPEGRQRDAS
ncbi:SDR family oxidoreductase [Kutzneria viridogrisea]|uniref:NAD(P)-dependent dehydrogenase (Short-subunit alcohol dehydrogenase family) n=1 Tax=Kutzneria viridogrisea TaxID=47990 RepID=A0ABR6BUT2_9PSEU|nr:NAD(P)-dependent dehydrogenase (short-subunit alcohol dehydrogenase family) [Kutzneria viridogrisea]